MFYTPYIAYGNLEKFLTSRKLIINKKYKKLEQEEFIRSIQSIGYIIFQAEDMEGKFRTYPENPKGLPISTYIVFRDEKSTETLKSNVLEKILKEIKSKTDTNIEIIFFDEEYASNFIAKKINKINKEEGDRYTYIMFYDYAKITTVIPEHSISSPHILMNKEEVEKFLKITRTSITDYPVIRSSDPQAIWIDARPGDFVKIINTSELSIYDPKYRRVD